MRSSTVTGIVVSCPNTTIPAESPTSSTGMPGVVEDPRGERVVGGEHGPLLAAGLGRGEVPDGDPAGRPAAVQRLRRPGGGAAPLAWDTARRWRVGRLLLGRVRRSAPGRGRARARGMGIHPGSSMSRGAAAASPDALDDGMRRAAGDSPRIPGRPARRESPPAGTRECFSIRAGSVSIASRRRLPPGLPGTGSRGRLPTGRLDENMAREPWYRQTGLPRSLTPPLTGSTGAAGSSSAC